MTDELFSTVLGIALACFFGLGIVCTLVFLAMMCADEFRKGRHE